MKEFLKTIIVLFIITAITLIIFVNFIAPRVIEKNSNTNSANSSSNTQQNLDEKNDDATAEESTGEDLLTGFSQTIIRDDTDDESYGNLGDSEIDLNTTADEYGLSVNMQVFDTNNNNAIDIGENTPIKITISNDSDKDYIIKDVNIDGDTDMFEDNSFTNIETQNIENQQYTFDRNRLSDSGSEEFTLKAGEECVYKFDALWSYPYIDGVYAGEYLQFNFSAHNDDLPAVYFEVGNQNYTFSNENI